jgi:hypothetical protein
MSLSLAAEAWTLSIFGWVWLTVQNLWLPSMLCSHVYYGFLLLTSCHLLATALVPDSRAPRVAYFNTVLGLCIFYACCIADTFDGYTFGGEQFRPPKSNPGDCCANCDIARANQVLFFADSPLYLAQAGTLAGYLIVHLLLAGAQQLDVSHRTVWSGTAWSSVLGMLLASRFIIVFDGSTLTLVPEGVFYLRLYSQPLLTLSVVFWLFFLAFIVLAGCEGAPRLNVLGFRIVRSAGFGVNAAFVVVSCVVFGLRGMLTTSLFTALLFLFFGSLGGVLEAFLGQEPERKPVSLGPVAHQARVPQSGQRARLPIPVQMPGGKKGA